MNSNITVSSKSSVKEQCMTQNFLGFDAVEVFNPDVTIKPDSFPFGSNWYYFLAMHFVAAVILNRSSNSKSEKYKAILEPVAFGVYIITIGVTGKLMIVHYTNENSIYYNIQDMFLMFIALFHIITTATFHLLVVQPEIQKTELLKWKKLIDLTLQALCVLLLVVIFSFSLLPIAFCPILTITMTLLAFVPPKHKEVYYNGGCDCDMNWKDRIRERICGRKNVLFFMFIQWAYMGSLTALQLLKFDDSGSGLIQHCCNYQNYTFKCITDFALILTSGLNRYVNDKMLPDEIVTKRRIEIEKIAMRERCNRCEATRCQKVSLAIVLLMHLLLIVAMYMTMYTDHIDIFVNFMCYYEYIRSVFISDNCAVFTDEFFNRGNTSITNTVDIASMTCYLRCNFVKSL